MTAVGVYSSSCSSLLNQDSPLEIDIATRSKRYLCQSSTHHRWSCLACCCYRSQFFGSVGYGHARFWSCSFEQIVRRLVVPKFYCGQRVFCMDELFPDLLTTHGYGLNVQTEDAFLSILMFIVMEKGFKVVVDPDPYASFPPCYTVVPQ
jgi:hypothetical protein